MTEKQKRINKEFNRIYRRFFFKEWLCEKIELPLLGILYIGFPIAALVAIVLFAGILMVSINGG